MKYRHAHHAGNFADVHKHVALLAVLRALKRKDKGFLYLETHAGRGIYAPSAEGRLGIERLLAAAPAIEELRRYIEAVKSLRALLNDTHACPGSPLLACQELRRQDRAILVEIEPAEARALELAARPFPHVRIEREDGFARLRAHLPPRERRGLTLIDPPYEESAKDFARAEAALTTALEKFATGVVMIWYPIKNTRDTDAWQERLTRLLHVPLLISEIWLYPPDSRVALNGSGLIMLNAPYQIDERMRAWLPQLQATLDESRQGGWRVMYKPQRV
jgi:23S rRNA (adenine2030-N6)-methyltransferase